MPNNPMAIQTNVKIPLVVDLDGTLTPADTLAESLLDLIKTEPICALKLPLWLLKGRFYFKEEIARHSHFSSSNLPFREPLLAYLREEKSRGRRIILATAAHKSIANDVAAHLGLFDEVLASCDGINLKGKYKLAAIQARLGEDFLYAGDSSADLPVWNSSKGAILVGVSKNTAARVRENVSVEKVFDNEKTLPAVWLRALRVHQWIKNLLLFIPLLTSLPQVGFTSFKTLALAFLAFSLAASATYVVNDFFDIDNDRKHPRKKLRPFASAKLSILEGVFIVPFFLASAIIISWTISQQFFLILMSYVVITSAYSWVLKRYVLIDVIVLSLLYTIRILAGSVAINESISHWLLAFSILIFLSLALVKRCSELVVVEKNGRDNIYGRDYRVHDLVVLWPLGVGAALSSIVVFSLFIHSPETQLRYAWPEMLWIANIFLVYWIGRLWIKTSRGEMHDDPVVYAINDRGSRITVISIALLIFISQFSNLKDLI